MSFRNPKETDFSSFGQENGLEVDDKHDILPQIDKLLGCKSMVEYIFVEPCRPTANQTLLEKFTQYSYGWGHAALRYRIGDDDFVVNLANPASGFADFVSFVSPAEYLFSTSSKAFRASEQYGIYGRSYQILRLAEGSVPEHQVRAMHNYFLELSKRADRKEVVWSSTPFHCYLNAVQRTLGLLKEEGGGCADWISRGLEAGGFISRSKRFPKAIWTSMMKNYCHLSKEGKIHMVSVRRAKHAKLHVSYNGYTVDDIDESLHSHKGPTSWLHWLSNAHHWNLEKFANLVVSCPRGTEISITEQKQAPHAHFEKGLLSWLLKFELEPWIVGFSLISLYNFSFSLYFALIALLFYVSSRTGHFMAFDALTAAVTMFVVAPISTVSNVFLGMPNLGSLLTVVIWFRLFYYWAS